MRKILMAGLMLVMIAGCEEPGNQVEIEAGKPFTPASSDVINSHGEIKNLEQLETFYENVQNDVKDRIRIVSCTVEGTYGTGELVKMQCKRIKFENVKGSHEYNLKECDKKEFNETVLWYD